MDSKWNKNNAEKNNIINTNTHSYTNYNYMPCSSFRLFLQCALPERARAKKTRKIIIILNNFLARCAKRPLLFDVFLCSPVNERVSQPASEQPNEQATFIPFIVQIYFVEFNNEPHGFSLSHSSPLFLQPLL